MDELERRLWALEQQERTATAPKRGVFQMREGESMEAARERATNEGYGAVLIVPKIPETEAEIERWAKQTAEYQRFLLAAARQFAHDDQVDLAAVSDQLRLEYARITST